jgi:hypothetical protein
MNTENDFVWSKEFVYTDPHIGRIMLNISSVLGLHVHYLNSDNTTESLGKLPDYAQLWLEENNYQLGMWVKANKNLDSKYGILWFDFNNSVLVIYNWEYDTINYLWEELLVASDYKLTKATLEEVLSYIEIDNLDDVKSIGPEAMSVRTRYSLQRNEVKGDCIYDHY